MKETSTWKIIEKRNIKSSDFYGDLNKGLFEMSIRTRRIFESIQLDYNFPPISLFRMKLAFLNLPQNSSYHSICVNARSLGFKPMTFQQVLALRSEYVDQPLGEELYIPITPIPDFDVGCYIISVTHVMEGFIRDKFYTTTIDSTKASLCFQQDELIFTM